MRGRFIGGSRDARCPFFFEVGGWCSSEMRPGGSGSTRKGSSIDLRRQVGQQVVAASRRKNPRAPRLFTVASTFLRRSCRDGRFANCNWRSLRMKIEKVADGSAARRECQASADALARSRVLRLNATSKKELVRSAGICCARRPAKNAIPMSSNTRTVAPTETTRVKTRLSRNILGVRLHFLIILQ
jgi:hypothetical protein